MEYITFPWEQLGGLLRSLSLTGAVGNVTAWIVFLAIGGVPLAAVLYLLIKKQLCRADILLPVLSAALYAGLWFFINPTYMDLYLSPAHVGGFAKYALAAVIYSVLLTWILLRCLSRYKGMERGKLLRNLRILPSVYVLFLTPVVLWQGGGEFITSCRALSEANSGAAALVPVSCFFLALQTAAGYLPKLLELALLVMVAIFIRSCEKDGFSEETCSKVEMLKKYSGRFLVIILLGNLGVNILQLLFGRVILSSHYALVFPFWEIIVVLGIMMVSLFYLEGKRLKEDNDMFI